MKKFIFIFLLSLLSCRSDADSDDLKTDQTLYIYVKDASGMDLLDFDLEDAPYSSVTLMDMGGEYDQESFSGYSKKEDDDGVYYYYYTAGATRNLVSEDGTNKVYRSDVAMNWYDVDGNLQETDTLSITYTYTPELFQVSDVKFNSETQTIERLTDDDELPYNVVNIVK